MTRMRRIVLLSVFDLLLTGCGWGYETPIGGEYILVYGDKDHRWISKRTNGKSIIVIDQQVTGVRQDGDHVLVRRMVAVSYECSDSSNDRVIITKRKDLEEFWILDVRNSVELGPFDQSAFLRAANVLHIADISIPNQVSYRPNEEAFRSRASHCSQLRQISWGDGMRYPSDDAQSGSHEQ